MIAKEMQESFKMAEVNLSATTETRFKLRLPIQQKTLLLEELYGQFMRRQFVDVSLVCKDGIVQANKSVLAGSSKYFLQIFEANAANVIYPFTIVLHETISAACVGALLKLIYCGETEVDNSMQAEEIMTVGTLLQIQGIEVDDSAEEGASSTLQSTPTMRSPIKTSVPQSISYDDRLKMSFDETEVLYTAAAMEECSSVCEVNVEPAALTAANIKSLQSPKQLCVVAYKPALETAALTAVACSSKQKDSVSEVTEKQVTRVKDVVVHKEQKKHAFNVDVKSSADADDAQHTAVGSYKQGISHVSVKSTRKLKIAQSSKKKNSTSKVVVKQQSNIETKTTIEQSLQEKPASNITVQPVPSTKTQLKDLQDPEKTKPSANIPLKLTHSPVTSFKVMQASEQKDSEMITNQSEVVTNQPEVVAKQSEVVIKQLEVVTKESELVTEQSEVVTKQLEVVTKESELVTEQSEVVTKQREVVTKQPEVVTKQPEVVTKQPDVVTKQPEVVTKQSEVVTTKQLEVRTKQPEVVTKQSEVVTTKQLEVRTKQPEVVTKQPEGVINEAELITKPEVFNYKPQKMSKLPKMVNNQPKEATKQPEVKVKKTSKVVKISPNIVKNQTKVMTKQPNKELQVHFAPPLKQLKSDDEAELNEEVENDKSLDSTLPIDELVNWNPSNARSSSPLTNLPIFPTLVTNADDIPGFKYQENISHDSTVPMDELEKWVQPASVFSHCTLMVQEPFVQAIPAKDKSLLQQSSLNIESLDSSAVIPQQCSKEDAQAGVSEENRREETHTASTETLSATNKSVNVGNIVDKIINAFLTTPSLEQNDTAKASSSLIDSTLMAKVKPTKKRKKSMVYQPRKKSKSKQKVLPDTEKIAVDMSHLHVETEKAENKGELVSAAEACVSTSVEHEASLKTEGDEVTESEPVEKVPAQAVTFVQDAAYPEDCRRSKRRRTKNLRLTDIDEIVENKLKKRKSDEMVAMDTKMVQGGVKKKSVEEVAETTNNSIQSANGTDGSFKCPYCKEQFPTLRGLNLHKRTHPFDRNTNTSSLATSVGQCLP